MDAACAAWPVLGRDGRWYRVCVTCDVIIPRGGTLPRWLRDGYACERDAVMGVRDHVRQMTRNRDARKRYAAWRKEMQRAARASDWEAFVVAYDNSPWGRFKVANIRDDLTPEEIMSTWIK